jgi:hypothetical protein
MIRSFSLLGLLGLLFQTAFAAAPQDDLCKTEQDNINTAIYVEGMLTQSFRTCSKGAISYIEVIASIDFDGGTVDVAIMDDTFTPKALQTFTPANYNGTSLILDNLAIPTLKNEEFTLVVRAMNGASCVIPGTDDATLFVGGARLHGEEISKNVKFSTGVRGATPNLNNALQDGRKADADSPDVPNNAMSRSAAGLDLEVSGDCASAQRQSNGVLNVNGGTFLQTFTTCERGRIVEAKIATPYVEEGFEYEYALMHFNGDIIFGGTFTSEDVTDGELKLTFEKGSVRKGQTVALKVTCPEDARIALLAIGVSNANYGRLYINGQSLAFNVAMAAGLETALAEDTQSVDDGRDALEISAYPNPFGESLSVQVRGTLLDGALLQVLDHQGMPVKTLGLVSGELEGPVRLDNLGDLRPGIYSLRLLNGRKAVSLRILKS